MKIFLTNPPWTKSGFFAVRAGSRWPHFEEEHVDYMPFPFFLAHATSWLEKHGFRPKLLDALALKMPHAEFYRQVEQYKPDFLGMEVSSFSMDNDLKIARSLRKAYPKMTLVFMGLANEMEKEDFVRKNPEVDYFLVGEYEDTLLELVEGLKKGQRPLTLAGATFLLEGGTFSGFQRRTLRPNINDYPWPSRDQLPMYNYHDEPGNLPCPSVQMWASRGCPFKCIFCAWPQIMYGNNEYRTRDILDLADEFEWLVTEWGFKSVYFDDDTFNVNKKRIASFCQELIRRGIKTPWGAMSRADLVDENLLKLMRQASVKSLKFGLESADQNAINNMEKNLNLKKAIENINLTHNYGIRTHLTFMFGLPGETRETAQKTLDLALHLNPWSLQMTIASPFPGSKFMEHLEKMGHLMKNVTEADGFRTSVVRTESMSAEELEEFVAHAQNRWAIHKARQAPRPGIGFRQKGLVSILIPNYNGADYLKNAVASALSQTWPNLEVIVIDNGSTDHSATKLKQAFSEIKLIELGENSGFAKAINTGIAASKGEYIAFLNSDAAAEPNWIQSLVTAVEEDPRVGFAASKILQNKSQGRLDSAGDGILNNGAGFNIAHGNPPLPEYERKRWVPSATGAACLYKRSVLQDLDPLPEDFFMYLEDLDLGLRAQLKGYKCVYVPEARVSHIGQASVNKIPGLKSFCIGKNSLSLILRTFPKNVLQKNLAPILLQQIKLFIWHSFVAGRPLAYLRGLTQSLIRIPQSLRERKRILGGRRISDEEFESLFTFSQESLELTRKSKNLAWQNSGSSI